MESINVTGLPEPAVRALEAIVQALRNQDGLTSSGRARDQGRAPRELAVIKGTVLGPLSRRNIYADDG